MAVSFTQRAMVSNILKVYRCATRDEKVKGAQWYPLAHNIVIEWADTFERSIANVACVIAAISPQCEWARNLVIADDILHGNPPSIGGAIHSFIRIAERVRDDRACDLSLYFKQGCKVQSFAANLAGDMSFATVDTHAAQIACYSPYSNLRVDTWRRYQPVAEAYQIAAQRKGMAPTTMQATTWLAWKRLYPAGVKRAIRRTF